MRMPSKFASDFDPDSHSSAENNVPFQPEAPTPDARHNLLDPRLVELVKDSQMTVKGSKDDGWLLLSHLGKSVRPACDASEYEPNGQRFSCVSDVVAHAAHFPLIQCLARDDGADPLDLSEAQAWADVTLCRAPSQFHANALFTTVEFSEFRRRNGQAVLERKLRSFPMPLGLMNSFTVDVNFGENGVVIKIGLEHEFAFSSIAIPEFGAQMPNLRLRDGIQNDIWGSTRARLRAASYQLLWPDHAENHGRPKTIVNIRGHRWVQALAQSNA